jgi:multidrug efflux pump subunit AcrB
MMSKGRLNFAGWLARTFITSKLTVVFVLGIALAGSTALLLTPREETPQIVVPGAQISVTLPGASAKEVEELIVTPLEGIVSGLTGVDHTYGTAMNSLGSVVVEFKPGQPKEQSLVKFYDRVISNLSRLPADAGTLQMRSIDVDDVPIVTITLASPQIDDYGLKRLADRMAERLRSTDDVSIVSVRGGRDREISVELDPERLEAFGISLSQVYAAFSASNLSLPLHATTRGRRVENIKLEGFFSSAEDVRNQVMGVHDGRPIYVRDIAVVTDGPRSEVEQSSRFAFGPADSRSKSFGSESMPAVTIAVAKKKGTNAVVVCDSIIERVNRMRENFVPSNVEMMVTRNDGQKADDAVNTLVEHLGIAVVSVGVILALFLGWKEALIVCVTIPLILFTAFIADILGKVTINRITLYGLILSLGLLVDASIVVIENIHRHYAGAAAGDKVGITIAATNEIGNATNLATFAVMLVFGSMILLTGMAGQYFFPVTYNVPIIMLFSIVIAYIVTPWAANRWLPFKPGKGHTVRHGFLERGYLRLITPLQESRKARLILIVIVFSGVMLSSLQGAWLFLFPPGQSRLLSSPGVALGFLPKDNKNIFTIVADMPENSPVEETDRLVRDIERVLAGNPHIMNYLSWLGQAGVVDTNSLKKGTADRTGGYVGEILVNLVDKQKRSISSIEIVRKLRQELDPLRQRYPGAKIRLVEDPPGPPMRATVLAEIHGPDLEGLRTLSEQVSQEFAKTYDMVDLSSSEPVDVAEHRIVVDKEKAALSNVSVQQIAQALQLVYGGDVVSRAHPDDEKNPVNVRAFVPRRHEVDPTRLDRTFIDNTQGQAVPLSELVKVTLGNTDRPILHKDNERVSFVGGELARSAPLYAVIDLNKRLKGMKTPDGGRLTTGNLTFYPQAPNVIEGYQVLWDGEMRLTLDSYRDTSYALGASLTSVFLLLVAYYRSFLRPMIVMSAVPLGLIGIFPGHWILGVDFSVASIVGIIGLSGIVVRNSLLIVDFVRDNVARGMGLEEAVRNAGAIRLRPILLTTLAVILGTGIMVPDPVFGGLAISFIFGTLASTGLTVFVVPTLFYMDTLRRGRKAQRQAAEQP